MNIDPDLNEHHDEEWLVLEIMKLRNMIRYHRDQEEDDRCHEDDTKLYELLPEKKEAKTTLPPKEVFLKSCERYWCQRQCPQAGEPVPDKGLIAKLVRSSGFLGDYGGRYEMARLLVEHGLYYEADSYFKHESRRRERIGNSMLGKQDE